MIYLDSAATTPIDPEVVAAMYSEETNYNPGSLHRAGRVAADAVSKARKKVSDMFCCEPDQVIFTSGGSEGNNLAIKGIASYLKRIGKTHLVISAIEHESVLNAVNMLIKDGFYVTYVKPTSAGEITAEAVADAMTKKTGLVSVMFANNEVGTVNPVEKIGMVAHQGGALFHCDCVQAAGQYPILAPMMNADFATVSGHKFFGPKGTGALFAKNKELLTPLISGGNYQEWGLRGGTENVQGIVGLGVAAERALESQHDNMFHTTAMKQIFYAYLLGNLGEGIQMKVNGLPVVAKGKVLSLTFKGVDAETLLLMLDAKGVCVSAGSACQSHEAKPSHVLTAMGISDDDARSTLRISFSKNNTEEEVLEAANIVASCVNVLGGSDA